MKDITMFAKQEAANEILNNVLKSAEEKRKPKEGVTVKSLKTKKTIAKTKKAKSKAQKKTEDKTEEKPYSIESNEQESLFFDYHNKSPLVKGSDTYKIATREIDPNILSYARGTSKNTKFIPADGKTTKEVHEIRSSIEGPNYVKAVENKSKQVTHSKIETETQIEEKVQVVESVYMKFINVLSVLIKGVFVIGFISPFFIMAIAFLGLTLTQAFFSGLVIIFLVYARYIGLKEIIKYIIKASYTLVDLMKGGRNVHLESITGRN